MTIQEHRARKLFDRLLITPDGCIEWTGALTKKGYGKYTFHIGGKSITQRVHRLVFSLFNGPIPDGLCIDHLCRNRKCANPSHLEAVTNKENSHRGVGFGSRTHQTHCVHGHEFTPQNTYVRREGTRNCKTCQRASERKWREKNGRTPHEGATA